MADRKTLYMTGDSMTRGIAYQLQYNMPWHTILEPAIPAYGISTSVKNDVLPLIITAQPDYVWMCIGVWAALLEPLITSNGRESLTNYSTNIPIILNSLLANTNAIIVVGTIPPLDEAELNVGTPFGFNAGGDDLSPSIDILQAALTAAINAIGSPRILVYDYHALIVDTPLPQPGGIHFNDDGWSTASTAITNYFKSIGMEDYMADQWSPVGADLGICPVALGNPGGGYTANKNIGNIASLGGRYQNCVLTGMDANNGFRYDPINGSYLKYDAATPDKVISTQQMPFTNANDWAIEVKVDLTGNNTNRDLCGARDGANDYWLLKINNNNLIQFITRFGGVTKQTRASAALLIGKHTIHLIKTGATFTIMDNGVEVAYAAQEAYNLGNVTIADPTTMGLSGSGVAVLKEKYFWFMTYDYAMSQTTALFNHNLGHQMNGIIGTVVGDNMTLSYPTTNAPVPRPHTSISIANGIM